MGRCRRYFGIDGREACGRLTLLVGRPDVLQRDGWDLACAVAEAGRHTTAYWSLEAGVERVLAAVGAAEVPAGLEVVESGPVDVRQLVAELRAGGAVIIDRLSLVRADTAGTRAQEEAAVLAQLRAAARAARANITVLATAPREPESWRSELG
jgi:hypothetical protein